MASHCLFTSRSINSFYWLDLIFIVNEDSASKAESVLISSPPSIALDQSRGCKYLCADPPPLHAHPFKVPRRSGSPLQTCTPKWLSIPTFLTLVDGSAVLPVAQPRPWIALESFLSNFPSNLLGNSLDSTFKLYPFLPSWLLLSQSACPSPLSWIVTIVAPSSLLPLLGTLLYILNTGSRISL